MHTFTTHTGEVVTGERLAQAVETVAQYIETMRDRVREADDFAPHVTPEEKEEYLKKYYTDEAEKLRTDAGHCSLSTWQRINTELTGECVGLLSKPKKTDGE